ncbi:glutathione hydrolase 1 proenzyme-like [Haemaphysalis longicornis]
MEVTSSCLMCAACLVLVIAVLGGVGYVTYTHTYFWMKYPALDWEYKNLAIVCSSGRCADIAMRIITESKGGLGDAAVAALACMGVLLPHKTGLGGGLLALYYNSSVRDELAEWSAVLAGRPAAIVPGAVSGYEYLHRRLGRLNWDTLFEPAINIAKEGFPVDKHLADALKRKDSVINADTKMRMVYWNHSTKAWKTVGDAINNDFLAKTLTQIAENGDRHFYSGRLAEDLVEDMRRGGSLVDIADFAHYRAHWSPTIKHTMAGGKKFHAPPVPGVGALLKVLVSDFALRCAWGVH